jgi:glutathione S-transferase
LNIQGLDYSTKYLHFLEIPETISKIVPGTPQATVPCITDVDGRTIQDSRAIALYLEEKYPTPSIFQGGQGIHFFFDNWSVESIGHKTFLLSVLAMYSGLDEEAKNYYRTSREAMFGTTLEEFAGNHEDHISALNKALHPIAMILAEYKFLTGDQVGWADIVIASHLVCIKKTRPDILLGKVLLKNDHLKAWWDRMETYANEDR